MNYGSRGILIRVYSDTDTFIKFDQGNTRGCYRIRSCFPFIEARFWSGRIFSVALFPLLPLPPSLSSCSSSSSSSSFFFFLIFDRCGEKLDTSVYDRVKWWYRKIISHAYSLFDIRQCVRRIVDVGGFNFQLRYDISFFFFFYGFPLSFSTSHESNTFVELYKL